MDTGEEQKEGPMELLSSQTMREQTDRQKESETEQQDRGTEVYREMSGPGDASAGSLSGEDRRARQEGLLAHNIPGRQGGSDPACPGQDSRSGRSAWIRSPAERPPRPSAWSWRAQAPRGQPQPAGSGPGRPEMVRRGEMERDGKRCAETWKGKERWRERQRDGRGRR